jgi:two-component system sensor histidine kinase AlgZ
METPADTRRDYERAEYLPDFCRPGTVLALVLISELVALVLSLGRPRAIADASFWGTMANTSLFLLWIALSGAAVLCYMRPALARRSVLQATAAALVLLVAVTGIISEAGWWLGRYWAFLGAPTSRSLSEPGHLMFVLGNMAIALIVSALALRYFYVSHHWRRNVELEATARVNALQARIRPHFLFNSLNTIAALTRREPGLAEEAIEDLADLFRASLRDSSGTMSLKEDLEIARLYQRMEQHRLGERLNVEWKVDTLPMRTQIPGLSLQPLLENAVYHGIEPLPEGGTVAIEGAVIGGDRIRITIRNPLPVDQPGARREGNRMALNNISERFRIAYGHRARVRHGASGQHFEVTLEFPLTESE